MANRNKTAMITIRCTPSFRAKFRKKAGKFGRPSEMHREILEAFVEDRLVIHPTTLMEKYNVD